MTEPSLLLSSTVNVYLTLLPSASQRLGSFGRKELVKKDILDIGLRIIFFATCACLLFSSCSIDRGRSELLRKWRHYEGCFFSDVRRSVEQEAVVRFTYNSHSYSYKVDLFRFAQTVPVVCTKIQRHLENRIQTRHDSPN